MSYDLYFWKSAKGPAQEVGHQLADEEVHGLEPSPDVERFRERLLTTWPDLADQISPWAPDLDWRQPWGRKDLAPYFVGLTLSWSTTTDDLDSMISIAREHGLTAYDPQTGEVIR
ncbi:hypothetical protein ACSNOI_37975 [Actinomadura kijaniata]|uniref:hypothetical protein n=1 Tax=Actinomadura kijaniata TaxID=46161 RepID=UPI003F1DD619